MKMERGRTLRIFHTNFEVVFLSIILIILTDVNHNVSAMSGLYFGKTIKSAATVKTIRSFTGVSIEECADECWKRAHCHYVDYLTRFKVCYIFNTTDPNEDFRSLYQNRSGSIVGVKTEWMPKTVTTVDPASLSECGQPEDISNAIRKGNIYTTESDILFECANSSDHEFSTCTALRVWEPMSLVCTPPIGDVNPCQQNNESWIYESSCYVLVLDNTMTWAVAKSKCEEQQGHLAHITSKEVQDNFEHHLGILRRQCNSDWMYIGVDDQTVEGHFQLSNGSNVLYTNWAGGEPNSNITLAASEDCVVMGPLFAYKWADVKCGNTYMAICEYDL